MMYGTCLHIFNIWNTPHVLHILTDPHFESRPINPSIYQKHSGLRSVFSNRMGKHAAAMHAVCMLKT